MLSYLIMSIFDKLKFWKHDELDFDALANKELHQTLPNDPMTQDPLQQDFGKQKSAFPEQDHNFESFSPARNPISDEPRSSETRASQSASSQGASSNKDMELINSKLDTIKAVLNSLDQRLAQVEQSMGIEQRRKLW